MSELLMELEVSQQIGAECYEPSRETHDAAQRLPRAHLVTLLACAAVKDSFTCQNAIGGKG